MESSQERAPFGGAGRAAGYVEEAPAPVAVVPAAPVEVEPAAAAPAPLPAVIDEDADADDLASASTVEAAPVAQRGMRGMLGRLGVKLAPGAAEQAELAALAEQRRDERVIRQATWTRAVSILVANRKGGVGKTPVSLLLGGTLAAVRGGSVAVLEVSDDAGTLGFRAEGTPALGVGELVRDVDTIRSAGQLAGYTAPQTSFASVIGTVAPRDALTGDDVRALARVIDDYYAVRVMDSGNQPSSTAFAGALDTADVLVIPVLNSADVVLEAVALLERLRRQGGRAAELADRAIVLRLTDGRPENPRIMARLTTHLERAGVTESYPIPYDAHIAERGQLTLDSLAPATRAAFTAAAAGVVRSLQTHAR